MGGGGWGGGGGWNKIRGGGLEHFSKINNRGEGGTIIRYIRVPYEQTCHSPKTRKTLFFLNIIHH